MHRFGNFGSDSIPQIRLFRAICAPFAPTRRRLHTTHMSAPSSPAAGASPWSRDARSEPLPTEIFTVEPQGPELDAAGLGVAIALEALMQDWHGPWVEKRAGGR